MARGRKLETISDYQRALKQKYGIGEGSSYKPWLRIQDVNSHGTRSVIFGRKSKREHHMMSSKESQLFYLAEFNEKVVDIREQFPIFPLNYSQRIAKNLGVQHPIHPKSKESIVMTTDQLLTISTAEGLSYHAISVKPESKMNDQRVLEKIDIERVCWTQLGVKFSVFTGNEVTEVQSRNIDWATGPFRENPYRFSQDQINFALSEIVIGQHFLADMCEQLTRTGLVSVDEAQLLLRFLIADKYINVDLSSYIPELGIIDVLAVSEVQLGVVNAAS